MINMPKSQAPHKGSFPLDHFKECSKFVQSYDKCLKRFKNQPKKCRVYQKEYFECRMDKGLMKKENLEKLGFTKDLD